MHRAGTVGLAEAFRRSTRGQIVDLLRCRPMTADELAGELGLTNKAIRAQLASLERDGIAREHGRTRSGKAGKPAVIYEFDSGAEGMFCSGYAPVLIAALDVLSGPATVRDRTKSLRKVGVELARGLDKPRARTLQDRLKHVTALLHSWGGLPRANQSDGTIVIESCGCPVSAAVRAHPETCVILEAMLSELLEVPVRERCERSSSPACRFEVKANGRASRPDESRSDRPRSLPPAGRRAPSRRR